MNAESNLATVTADDLMGLGLEELTIFQARVVNALVAEEISIERCREIQRAWDKAFAAQKKAMREG